MHTYSDYLEGECTLEEFKSTLKLVQPELGKVYMQQSASWAIMHFKIIYQNEHVSLGVCVYNDITKKPSGEYELFNTRDGFKYGDTRHNYRLIKEVS